jgi:hypothetical protein
VTCSHMAPDGPGASEVRRDPPCRDDPPRRPVEHEPSPRHFFDGSDHPDSDSMQRHSSRARLMTSTSTPSAPQGDRLRRRPAAPLIFDHLGRRSPGRTCFPPHWRGSRAGLRRGRGCEDSPEPPREHNTVLEPPGRSELAPESAERREPAFELVGAKRAAPEPGSSDRSAKRTWVHSKM